MFTIEVDRFHAMIHHRGRGFWTKETAEQFLAAERDAIADLGVPVRNLTILFDASKFSVQSQEVIDLLRHPANPLYNALRGAFVTPPGLGSIQIKMGNRESHIGVFETEAEAWQFLRQV